MRIGFIGLGLMGEPMCYNIIKKHDDAVYVFDIDEEKTALLERSGGIGCQNARETALNSDVIITVVPRSEHSLSVYSEIEPVMDETKICIDMSTIDPEASEKIYHMLKAHGTPFLDAPIVKSRDAAWLGDVGIYVGGDFEVYKQIKPVLQYMGRSIMHMGEHGKGLMMKICHNALVAQIQNGVNETLALALKEGIDIDKFSAAISYGGGQNSYYDSKQMALRYKDYTTQFSVSNMAKDLEICHNLVSQMHVHMPGLEVAREVYHEAMAAGDGGKDFCSTIEIVIRNQEKN
ncbi:MAG TPA: NAD(P)-dependent oxidoreductase [Candidatus Scybalocola faecipullorum]|nr:NAD(P)-dependent oxidoreductase [Candidatus Scybalocola faecipullorum]